MIDPIVRLNIRVSSVFNLWLIQIPWFWLSAVGLGATDKQLSGFDHHSSQGKWSPHTDGLILGGERKATPFPHEILSDRITGSTCESGKRKAESGKRKLSATCTILSYRSRLAANPPPSGGGLQFFCNSLVRHDCLLQAVIYGIPRYYHDRIDPVILSKNIRISRNARPFDPTLPWAFRQPPFCTWQGGNPGPCLDKTGKLFSCGHEVQIWT